MQLDDMHLVVYDCEVFAKDWLFVLRDLSDGSTTAVWNDPDALWEHIDQRGDAVYVGFNNKHYDQYIMKAVLGGLVPAEVKEVNDWIISPPSEDALPWEHPYLEGARLSVPQCDLMDDVQAGTSLKSIEGHLGMDIRESSVGFDHAAPLKDAERLEVQAYCEHDVEATCRLLELRRGYLQTKLDLADRAGLAPEKALGLTNAKLTAAVLGAEATPHGDERAYVLPPNLLVDLVPSEALAFFGRMADASVPDDELWSSKLDLEVGGCPVTLGFGGIHGALPCCREAADGRRAIVNIDVSSYYPSLMVKNGYTSRNMADPGAFRRIYEERLAAKAAGDKATADALKLIVNTAYGATLNPYNALYDPRMARSVCVSGQLYLLELAEHLVRGVPGLRLIQLNTDGIMVSVDRGRLDGVRAIYGEWEERTGFMLEEDDVSVVWQKDVNNYALRMADGKEKVKGGYLVRGISKAGAFSVNNNAPVVADALRRFLLDGTPVRDTVMACGDSAAFQLIAKAGHKYSEVWQETSALGEDGVWGPGPDMPMQKCNRVFAGLDRTRGRLFKRKASDGSVAKVEGLPDLCLVSNGAEPPPIHAIDREWYVRLAERRAEDFIGKKKEGKRAMASSKAVAEDYSGWNVYKKLAEARRLFLKGGPKKSGVNPSAGFDYFELADIVPAQTEIFAKLGLLERFAYVPGELVGTVPGKDGEAAPVFSEPLAVALVVNTDDPSDKIEFRLKWSQVPPIISGKTGKEVNTEIQRTGGEQTYMRRYLKMQVLDIVEADAVDSGKLSEGKGAAAAEPERKAPPTEGERRETAKAESAPDGGATPLQLRQLKKSIKTMMDSYGADHPEVGQYVADLSVRTQKLESISKAECEQAIRELGAMRESIERGA